MNLSDFTLTPLSHIKTPGGDVLHAMKESDTSFAGFGEAYFSWVDLGKIKAWKRHREMTLNIIVPVGNVRFAFCALATNGLPEFRIENVGVERFMRITVPPGIWFGFQGLSQPQSLVLNIANIEHNPSEVENADLKAFKFDWAKDK